MLNQIIRMATNMILRRGMSGLMNAGLKAFDKRGTSSSKAVNAQKNPWQDGDQDGNGAKSQEPTVKIDRRKMRMMKRRF